MTRKEKKDRTMAEVSKGYEDFIKNKETAKDGRSRFNKAIKKSAKQRGSK